MRYILRQKMLSLADGFQIKNEDGTEAYLVNGKTFSLAKQLTLEDLAGTPLLAIKQQLLAWTPTYQIDQGDALVATVTKELFNLLSYRFVIELAAAPSLDATGDFTNHEYTITRGETPIATISKQWFAFTDTYGIDIAAKENDLLLLAIAVVIDMVCHPDQK